jgi:hypothetical protein
MSTIDKAFYNAIYGQSELEFMINGKYPISSAKIQQTSAPDDLISETVLNGYLHLLNMDVAHTRSLSFSYHIFDTLLADQLQNTPLKPDLKPPVMAKTGRSVHRLWVPEVSLPCTHPISFFA